MKTSKHEINGNNAPDRRNGPDMTQKVQLEFTDERGVATHSWCPFMSETKSSFQRNAAKLLHPIHVTLPAILLGTLTCFFSQNLLQARLKLSLERKERFAQFVVQVNKKLHGTEQRLKNCPISTLTFVKALAFSPSMSRGVSLA